MKGRARSCFQRLGVEIDNSTRETEGCDAESAQNSWLGTTSESGDLLITQSNSNKNPKTPELEQLTSQQIWSQHIQNFPTISLWVAARLALRVDSKE